MSTIVGVDGCKAGWFYFRKDGTSVSYGVATDLRQLTNILPSGSRIFIDIPIGLIDSGGEGRTCDRAARKVLGSPRASSVFPAPAYPVLQAKDYAEAKKLSQRAIGKMLSKQAFMITPKIREVNEFLAANLNSGYTIREVHPEVCFWGLNDRSPMQNKKKCTAGFEERLAVLEKCLPNARDIIDVPLKAYLRREVARDDILDALVGMVVACAPDAELETLPPVPEIDSRELPMEIVFRRQQSAKNSKTTTVKSLSKT